MESAKEVTTSGKTSIFALGSAHGDDQIAWRVAERLTATLADAAASIRIAGAADQLLDCLEGVDRLVVCDACRDLGSPGRMHGWRWPNAPLENLHSSGTHDLNLANVLALAEALCLLPADVIILGVEGAVFLPGAPLHADLEDAVNRVVEAVRRILFWRGNPRTAGKQCQPETPMHERSLVRALLAQVERLVANARSGQVVEIRVQMGPLSNVEPMLIESAFQALSPESVAAGARLVLEEVPLTGCCTVCRRQFEIVRFQFHCPECGAPDIEVTAGDGFVLESITLSDEETAVARP